MVNSIFHMREHVYFRFQPTVNLKKVCVWSVGLEERSLGLLDTRRQREFDLWVVHLLNKRSSSLDGCYGLNTNNLDAVGTGTVTSSHIPIALGHSSWHSQVAIFAIHVVGSRPGIVTKPDTEILDLQRFFLGDLLHTNNLAGSFLEFPQLTQKVPKSRQTDIY